MDEEQILAAPANWMPRFIPMETLEIPANWIPLNVEVDALLSIPIWIPFPLVAKLFNAEI